MEAVVTFREYAKQKGPSWESVATGIDGNIREANEALALARQQRELALDATVTMPPDQADADPRVVDARHAIARAMAELKHWHGYRTWWRTQAPPTQSRVLPREAGEDDDDVR